MQARREARRAGQTLTWEKRERRKWIQTERSHNQALDTVRNPRTLSVGEQKTHMGHLINVDTEHSRPLSAAEQQVQYQEVEQQLPRYLEVEQHVVCQEVIAPSAARRRGGDS